ncbi:MAG: epoxyqueuosine reductase QueH [Eubacterium sp.]|nr:epoxyqueuosine reductase QueH [Eubacterium sp.]
MAQNRNYQKESDAIIEGVLREGKTPSLLLHACCAPCSSYCLEYLSDYFSITLYYYNPNIGSEEEYRHRCAEAQRLVNSLPVKNPVSFLESRYEPERYYEAVSGLEQEPEGGKRCEVCFRLRLSEAAKAAKEGGFDFFTTTLSISPLKNAQLLNEIGKEISEEYGVSYFYSDFKKKGGYQRSIELSREYDLYRQNFCGCIFSKRDALQKAKEEIH